MLGKLFDGAPAYLSIADPLTLLEDRCELSSCELLSVATCDCESADHRLIVSPLVLSGRGKPVPGLGALSAVRKSLSLSSASAKSSASSELGSSKPAKRLLFRIGRLILFVLPDRSGPSSFGYLLPIWAAGGDDGGAVKLRSLANRFPTFRLGSVEAFPALARERIGSGLGGFDEIADGRRLGGSFIRRRSILISSVCIDVERSFTGGVKGKLAWQPTLFVCGGKRDRPLIGGDELGG